MKICSIRIKGFQQFQDVFLDFTNPETGEPADRVCFIGRNGVGKSTLLDLIKDIFGGNNFLPIHFILEVSYSGNRYIISNNNFDKKIGPSRVYGVFEKDNLSEKKIDDLLEIGEPFDTWGILTKHFHNYFINHLDSGADISGLFFFDSGKDLLIHSPIDSFDNQGIELFDLPDATLNNALGYFDNIPFINRVSNSDISTFWNLFIFQEKKLQDDRDAFENREENLDKIKRVLKEEFDSKNPRFLYEIKKLWDQILNPSGLYFDADGAKIPIQLSENLEAYIKLISNNETIPYNKLSTGIRDFIFRIGHIRSLYFNRTIQKGLMLVDEPEFSLFPDFQMDLIDLYESLTVDKNGDKNTQMFFATHSPLIASQFEPWQRIILEWNPDGTVSAHKGVAPIGDDSNDILVKDFKSRVLPPEGEKQWKLYVEKQQELAHTQNNDRKKVLIKEIGELGRKYNFGDEISD